MPVIIPAPLSNPYTGIVASRCGVQASISAPNKQLMSRSMHFARDYISAVSVGFANWYTQANSENNMGATATITGSIEYPSGTFTQLKFSGAVQATMADGATVFSDYASVSIPIGAQFWVRAFYTCTSGIPFCSLTNTPAAGPDLLNYAASGLTDQTMGGTVTNQTLQNFYRPIAIIGVTTRPSILICGDSRNYGAHDVTNDSSGDIGELPRLLGTSFGYINVGHASDKLVSGVITNYTKRLTLAQYCTHVIDALGINDIGSAAATIATNRTTFAGLFTLPVYGTTLPPQTTSSDAWATATNQTVTANEANRTGFNDLARAGISGEVGCFDLADVVEVNSSNAFTRNGGRWNAPASGAITDDGLHEVAGGNLLYKRSTVIDKNLFLRY